MTGPTIVFSLLSCRRRPIRVVGLRDTHSWACFNLGCHRAGSWVAERNLANPRLVGHDAGTTNGVTILRYWIFVACLLWLAWSAAQLNVLWTILAYVLAGVFWVAHDRQKDIMDQSSAATHLKPLLAVAIWPVIAGNAARERIRALTSPERYLVYYGDLSTNQEAHFPTWGKAVSFARQKAVEQASTASETASPLHHHVIIIDYGRLRPSRGVLLKGLQHAQFEVQESGEVRRII